MSTQETVQALWLLHERGDFFPSAWRGKLDLDEAYRVQLGLLDAKLADMLGAAVGIAVNGFQVFFGQ